jgi:acylphosphatase
MQSHPVDSAGESPQDGGDDARPRRTGALIRRRAIVHGRVQGVFFRDTTRRRAVSRGVAGWVRNLPDGTVEAVFEGDSEAVEALVAFCREGPRGALVERLEVSEQEPRGLDAFEVR